MHCRSYNSRCLSPRSGNNYRETPWIWKRKHGAAQCPDDHNRGVLLWFGWFGFNAGSALAANGLAASAFIVTNTAAAAGALTWTFVSWMHGGKPNTVGIITGAVAGLVAITPASGFVGVVPAIIIGIGAGIFCYFAMHLRSKKTNIDDSLDVMACHGVGGTWGAIATGIFASLAINPL